MYIAHTNDLYKQLTKQRFFTLFPNNFEQLFGKILTSVMLFIQFWMFSKDFSSVMSYTRTMP